MCVFSMLGTIMFLSKLIMEALPNIHLVGTLVVVYTLVYRKKALIPIYVYVFLVGVYAGFNWWWMPYIYIWTILWGLVMLLPRKMNERVGFFVYPTVCALHGLAYGTLYAPAQAIMFKLSFEKMLLWIAAGFTFDLIHAVGNLVLGLLIFPLTKLLTKLSKQINII